MVRKLVGRWVHRIRVYRHRRFVQKTVEKGLILGRNVTIMNDVRFDHPHNSLISIGDNSTIAHGVAFIAHDGSTFKALGHSRIGRIDVRENTFIGERCILLPGVTIGPNVLVGAGSVVTKDIPEGTIAGGNPAKVLGSYWDFLDRQKKYIAEGVVFDQAALYSPGPEAARMWDEIRQGAGRRFYTRGQAGGLRGQYRFNTEA